MYQNHTKVCYFGKGASFLYMGCFCAYVYLEKVVVFGNLCMKSCINLSYNYILCLGMLKTYRIYKKVL